MKYEILTSEPAPKRVPIEVRQLGIGKFVYVRRER